MLREKKTRKKTRHIKTREEADHEHGEQEEIRHHGFEDQEETQAKTTSTTWRESNGLTERPSNERSAMRRELYSTRGETNEEEWQDVQQD